MGELTGHSSAEPLSLSGQHVTHSVGAVNGLDRSIALGVTRLGAAEGLRDDDVKSLSARP
jgi:hypothetical protein